MDVARDCEGTLDSATSPAWVMRAFRFFTHSLASECTSSIRSILISFDSAMAPFLEYHDDRSLLASEYSAIALLILTISARMTLMPISADPIRYALSRVFLRDSFVDSSF